jgi:hypothetical protein
MDPVDIVEESIPILPSRPAIRVMLTDIEMPGSMNVIKLAFAIRDRWLPIGHRDLGSDRPESLSGRMSIEAIQAFDGVRHERARYYPEDDLYLLEKPEGVERPRSSPKTAAWLTRH